MQDQAVKEGPHFALPKSFQPQCSRVVGLSLFQHPSRAAHQVLKQSGSANICRPAETPTTPSSLVSDLETIESPGAASAQTTPRALASAQRGGMRTRKHVGAGLHGYTALCSAKADIVMYGQLRIMGDSKQTTPY